MLNFNFKKLCFVCEYFANAFFIVHNKFFNFLFDVGSDDYNLSLAFKKGVLNLLSRTDCFLLFKN